MKHEVTREIECAFKFQVYFELVSLFESMASHYVKVTMSSLPS
jgi:hypothetical protein